MAKEVVLTGLRSNAEFHIGNYLGAILPMVELQKKHAGQYQLNMFIPDLHSFTTPIEHGKLYDQTIENLRAFVAAGLDVDQPDTFIYRQSYISAHSEMTWILDCFAYFGELSRMTEFKEKGGMDPKEVAMHAIEALRKELGNKYWSEDPTEKINERIDQIKSNINNVSVGLFNYPVLMAADILLYSAKFIPVGDDQRQHVEFTRDLAMRMNNKFGDLFVVPEDNKKQSEFAGRADPVRIRSLRNPEKKMSKSIDDPSGTIMLNDDPEAAAQKVLSAATDSLASIKYDWQNQPGVTNLLQMLALLTGASQQYVNEQWHGKSSYSQLKGEVAQQIKRLLTELQYKLSQVDNERLVKKLEQDESVVNQIAEATLLRVQQAVGLRPKSRS